MSANTFDQCCNYINSCDCILICLDETIDIKSSARLEMRGIDVCVVNELKIFKPY